MAKENFISRQESGPIFEEGVASIDIPIGEETESILKGVPSAPGAAIGKAVIIKPETIRIPTEKIPEIKIPEELERFNTALRELIIEFLSTIDKVKKEALNVSAILESNLMMLSDSFFQKSIIQRINDRYPVESSVVWEIDRQKQFFKRSKDKILRERAVELDHIKERLLGVLRNRSQFYSVGAGSIVVAQSLTLSDIVNFREAGIVGIITEVGGIASHASILARSFKIPAVIGVQNAAALISQGSRIVVDGYEGIVICNPGDMSVSMYREKKSREERRWKKMGALVKLPSTTLDGKEIKLLSNINFLEDVEAALLVGAEGVGLVRTEHLIFPTSEFPGEDRQYSWYKELADRSYPHHVSIRAFDVGSDKYAEGLPKHEDNPALGLRGVRFLLSRADLFEIQLSAILRASRNKNVKLLLPMISRMNEVEDSLALIERCKERLRRRNELFDENMPVGLMIETPAAAMIAGELAELVDFFSIGTNDLTQYTVAADRTNELVADHFDSFHPSVLRIIKIIVEAAKKRNISVGVCGELASHAAATALLIGLNIDELSVPPSILLELKSRIREISYKDSIRLAEDVLFTSCQSDVRKILNLSISSRR